MTHISIDERENGSMGIAHTGISVMAGHDYQLSLWLKGTSNMGATIALYGCSATNGSRNTLADANIASISGTMTKYTVTLTPTASDSDACLFIGGAGIGDLWIDQISLMPLDASEVSCGGWRTDFVESLRALGPGALRWPGGILSDWYD